MKNFHFITLFEEVIKPYFNSSILGRAKKNKKIKIFFYNPIDFLKDKSKRIDSKPYGGGPGMVLQADPILRAIEKAKGKKKKVKVIFLTPSGKKLTKEMVKKYAKNYNHFIFVSGHYEGVDARVAKIVKMDKIAIGDNILSGGEIPSLYISDAIIRHIPEVLGNAESLEENRISSNDVYTRPKNIRRKGKNWSVPPVLLTGHHKDIEKWRKENSNDYGSV